MFNGYPNDRIGYSVDVERLILCCLGLVGRQGERGSPYFMEITFLHCLTLSLWRFAEFNSAVTLNFFPEYPENAKVMRQTPAVDDFCLGKKIHCKNIIIWICLNFSPSADIYQESRKQEFLEFLNNRTGRVFDETVVLRHGLQEKMAVLLQATKAQAWLEKLPPREACSIVKIPYDVRKSAKGFLIRQGSPLRKFLNYKYVYSVAIMPDILILISH